MNTVTRRSNRAATPQRWQSAAKRAIAGNVQVRQIAGSGTWIATSATDATVAYQMEVIGEIVLSCECAAAQYGDEVCVHRAAAYLMFGTLELWPEEVEEPAAAPAPVAEIAPAVTAVVVMPEVEYLAMQGETVWGTYATRDEAQRKCSQLSRIYGCVPGEPIRVRVVQGTPRRLAA